MGIREGDPCPTIAMKVGTGRARSMAGVMEAVRVRMYSWQFWREVVSGMYLLCFRLKSMGRGRGGEGETYTAEEMPYKDDQYPSRYARSCI
jgi:hypothetical protein